MSQQNDLLTGLICRKGALVHRCFGLCKVVLKSHHFRMGRNKTTLLRLVKYFNTVGRKLWTAS